MTTTTTVPMTHAEIRFAAELLDGCRHGRRVQWAVNGDVTMICDGVLRHITDERDTGNHARPDRDIREQWVRISGTFEYWLPVTEVIELMRDQLFVIQGDK